MRRKRSSSTVSIIGNGITSIKVCDIKNGRPKVKLKETEDYYEFRITYSFFSRETKRYDKRTLKEVNVDNKRHRG